MKRFKFQISLSLLVLTMLACSEPFESFNTVSKLRVLAVRADLPDLHPGQTATLDALVVSPDGAPVTYEWSWCPLTTSALQGYECLIDEAALTAGGIVGTEAFLPALNLGTNQTARFSYDIDAKTLKSACQLALSQTAPAFVELPDCQEALSISVKLVVRSDTEEITAIKQLNLLLDDTLAANQNPHIDDIAIYDNTGKKIALLDESATATENQTYDLKLDIDDAVSEPYTTSDGETTNENMFLTWFVTGGETEFQRTGYLPGSNDFDILLNNNWKIPTAAESNGVAHLYVVLQDERGGVTWQQVQINIAEVVK